MKWIGRQDARLDDELSELFKVIDVDQNDQITASELHAVVTHAMVRWGVV